MKYHTIGYDDDPVLYRREDKSRIKTPPKHQPEVIRCQHCHEPIGNGSREEIGTRNRNHCPNCLWSVHVGETSPKDRNSDCCAGMEPVALTIKMDHHGELMLVHVCTQDKTVRFNRLAADDNSFQIEEVFSRSLNLLPETRKLIESAGVKILGRDDEDTVKIQLFGKG